MPKIIILACCLSMLTLSACQNNNQETNNQEMGRQTTDSNLTAHPELTNPGTTPKQGAVTAKWLLVPGKSAGATTLRETSASVTQRLGPADGGDAATMHTVSVWYADSGTKSGHTLSVFTVRDAGNDPAARVTQIRVNSPRFQTRQGVGSGTSLAKIERLFQVKKVKEVTDKGPTYTLYDDSEAGIAFEINGVGACQGVIIHEVGKPFAGSYLTFP